MDTKEQIELHSSLAAFFTEVLSKALQEKNLALTGETLNYLVHLMEHFSLNGCDSQSLAERFLASTQAEDSVEKIRHLKQVGDEALYVAGLFSESLSTKLVGQKYYVRIGGVAFANLQALERARVRVLIFSELAQKFAKIVDVLAYMQDAQRLSSSNTGLLEIFEKWQQSRDENIHRKLIAAGIDLSEKSDTSH